MYSLRKIFWNSTMDSGIIYKEGNHYEARFYDAPKSIPNQAHLQPCITQCTIYIKRLDLFNHDLRCMLVPS